MNLSFRILVIHLFWFFTNLNIVIYEILSNIKFEYFFQYSINLIDSQILYQFYCIC